MFIYKITNLINGKIYVGKTTKTIEKRWRRHVYDAENDLVSTHLSKAIKKYGAKNFKVEKIDSAKDEIELNNKEKYWISFYNSTNREVGYNLCAGGEGGNTYQFKSEKDMAKIKAKISESKMGSLNPHSAAVKCKNVDTGEELHFDTTEEMKDFFNERQHSFITSRCLHKIRCLYKKKWLIAYETDEYDYTCTREPKYHRSRNVIIQSKRFEKEFGTFTEAEEYFDFNKGTLSRLFNKFGREFLIDDKKVIVLE